MHADNLRAMADLRGRFAETFALAYLDPPFNTGRTFAEYKDALTPNDWLAMMRPRILEMHALLRPDGALVAEIDDTMVAGLQALLDGVFGRDQRVSTITVVRSAGTGHKAKNRGPVNVTDFLLVYEKKKGAWRYRPQHKVRAGYDPAYRTWVRDPRAPLRAWTFEPLRRVVARHLGFPSGRAAATSCGAGAFEDAVVAFAFGQPDHVVRFAQPRFEAVSQAARALILRSRLSPLQVFRLRRGRHPDMLLRGGNRILFLSSKVRTVAGTPRIVEPLTNVWDDIGFQGIAKEGGVVFSRNKKPERLLGRIIAMTTDPGDWVLDPFLGSGTTAAVAHKMGRRWVGIEVGDQLEALSVPRLLRVVLGEDKSGVTREAAWTKGGGFRVLG